MVWFWFYDTQLKTALLINLINILPTRNGEPGARLVRL